MKDLPKLPALKPVLFAFVPLAELETLGEADAIGPASMALYDQGAVSVRETIVAPDRERRPYPHGAYLEGWLDRPQRGQAIAAFHFPLAKAA